MKFRKRLQRLLDDSLPEWRDKFISYKRLKQCLKLIVPADEDNPLCFSQHYCNGYGISDSTGPVSRSSCSEGQESVFCRSLARQEEDFIGLLNAELDKMNTFFMEKEEEFVIRLQDVKGKFEKLQETSGGNLELSHEMVEIRKAIVNIHGEMVLLENYSAWNYTGLVKIIKKHDKRTGGLLRVPFIQSVLQEPFFETDIISKLIRECQETLKFLFPLSTFHGCRSANSAPNGSAEPYGFDECDPLSPHFELAETFAGDNDEESIWRNTMAAWRIMREFRKGSSTYNFYSIPPFGHGDYDEAPCCKSAITEQVHWYAEIPVCSNL